MTNNIDIVITVVLRSDYVRLLIKSIDRYTKYPYKIYIVTDIRNNEEQELFDSLNAMYADRDDIFIIKSENTDTRMGNEDWVNTPVDGRRVGLASIFKTIANETGIKAGNGKYVCLLDYDCVFLSEWTERILPLVDKNFFVSGCWREEGKMGTDQFFIYERNNLESRNLMPDCTVYDCGANISRYALENNIQFYICPNSNRAFGNSGLRKYHVMNLEHGEQIFVPNNKEELVPILYHYGRGSARQTELYDQWCSEVSKYLEKN